MKIGIDMEKLSRMNEKLISRVATEAEMLWLEKFSDRAKLAHMGSIWSAKEAAIKALGQGEMKDVELAHTEDGRPQIRLHGKAKQLFESLGLTEIEVSISHTQTDVICLVVMQ